MAVTMSEALAAIKAMGTEGVVDWTAVHGAEQVTAKAISHPCGHREDLTFVPSRVADAHAIKVAIADEHQRDCWNCRFAAGMGRIIGKGR